MIIVKTIAKLKEVVNEQKQLGKTVGFVPTMGYLHEGHISLVEAAKQISDVTVLSIFVNPLQFGPNEDFSRYPRDFERDEGLARNAGVDIIFYPDVKEMYPNELRCKVIVQKGVDVLCGKSRPGHFDGVATVVLKLFNIVNADYAFFGLKDAQQVAVIENLVNDFNLPTTIVKCPTLREKDGLAKSSRNVYLSDQERREAHHIYKSLILGKELIINGEDDTSAVKATIIDHLSGNTSGTIDYVEIYSYPSLIELKELKGQLVIAIALKFTKARLIDNIIFEV